MEYLLCKYKEIVLSKTRPYFLKGAERDDMIQEGMIGLFKAIRDYRPHHHNCSFHTFADTCITRQIITAVRGATRRRHLPLINAVFLDGESDDTEWPESTAAADTADPEQLSLARERVREIQIFLKKKLSEFERRVAESFFAGKSYQQIADEQGTNPHSVGNALCRVRRKLSEWLARNQPEI